MRGFREKEGEREETSPLPLPVVPAGPVSSPTWRRRTEEEVEREREREGASEGGTAT